jgi:hypothetical protein
MELRRGLDSVDPLFEPDQNERAAEDFNDADERGHDFGRVDADFRKAPNPVFAWVEEFLNPLREEDSAYCESDENH